MSLSMSSPRQKRAQAMNPQQTAQQGMPSVSEFNPQDLLQQSGMSPLALGGGLQDLLSGKVGDNELLKQLIAGMSGNGLFGS